MTCAKLFNVKLAQRVLVSLAPEMKIAFLVCPLARLRERVRERVKDMASIINRSCTFTMSIAAALFLSGTVLFSGSALATPHIQQWQAASGARVYFVEDHDLPMLDVAVDFPAGSGFDEAAKPGVAGLYGIFKVACVPVALDSGCYWQGFTKLPGTISLEFLQAIPPGLRRSAFMPLLQGRIETATDALLKSRP